MSPSILPSYSWRWLHKVVSGWMTALLQWTGHAALPLTGCSVNPSWEGSVVSLIQAGVSRVLQTDDLTGLGSDFRACLPSLCGEAEWGQPWSSWRSWASERAEGREAQRPGGCKSRPALALHSPSSEAGGRGRDKPQAAEPRTSVGIPSRAS